MRKKRNWKWTNNWIRGKIGGTIRLTQNDAIFSGSTPKVRKISCVG